MTEIRKNKLGTMPIPRLIISMSIPMMISFFIQALYNIVDSIFVAKISEDALTAVSIAFPVQQLITALGVGTGVAVNALVSRYNGQKKPEMAEKIANVTAFLSFCYTVLFLIIGLTCISQYYALQTDVPAINEAGIQYLTIVCCVSAGAFFGQNFEKLLVATGHSLLSMTSQASGAVFNLIFDPLLIFGIGPFPRMGVRGAAAATVAGQIAAALIAYILLKIYEKNIRLDVRKMLPTLPILKNIFSIAFPSMITVGLTSVMSFGMNQILLSFSTTATAVFGIWMKLQNFAYMPIFGMNNGTVPIISYNYGAGRQDRVEQTIHIATRSAVILMSALAVILMMIPIQLLHLFSAGEQMMAIGTIALRIAVVSLPFGAYTMISSSAFQALNHPLYSLVVSICRQVIFVIPVAWLLSLSGSLSTVWLCIPLAEIITVAVSVFYRHKVFRELGLR